MLALLIVLLVVAVVLGLLGPTLHLLWWLALVALALALIVGALRFASGRRRL